MNTCPGQICGPDPYDNNGNRLWTFSWGVLNPYGTVDITATIPAGYTHTILCTNNDTGLPQSCVNGGYSSANVFHGSSFTYKFVAPNIPTPLFVIGDVEPHALSDNVYFWGAQWWKNNEMSGPVDPGAVGGSFKGYASSSDNFCGGVWATRPGNSPPPPAEIGQPVAIIVTSTVLKNGPVISGNIVQILLVHHDGNYDNNPGHPGRGPVVEILCTVR